MLDSKEVARLVDLDKRMTEAQRGLESVLVRVWGQPDEAVAKQVRQALAVLIELGGDRRDGPWESYGLYEGRGPVAHGLVRGR